MKVKNNKKVPFIKKSAIIFILQMFFLIFSLVLILWGKKKLKSFSQDQTKNPKNLERKAKFLLQKEE
ncbi:MAG: hypothetical protein GDA46_00625 [Bdellovibrionales bacterium]|nr:hypothetical protein [Bdellovibrionales bacterium]